MKKILLLPVLIAFIMLLSGPVLFASDDALNPLEPVKTDNPRDTMRTFMESMNKYKNGKEKRDPLFETYLDRAVRCFDLSAFSFVEQQQRGREAAILLKEVIDRVIVIDYEKIPEKSEAPGDKLLRWRLKGTEIVISMQESGDRAGEYLFSSDTTRRVREFYSKVKHLPYKKGTGQGALYKDAWFEQNVPLWMKEKFFYLYIWQWAGLFFSILTGLILKVLVKFFVDFINVIFQKKSGLWLKKVANSFSGPTGWIGAILFWYIAVYFLGFDGIVLTVFNVVLKISLSGVFLWLVYRLINVLSDYLVDVVSKTESTLDDQLVPLLNKAIKIFVIIFGVLIIIQNLGVNVVSVLAGLGIGGFAIAFAAKDMVANFFGSLMILFDSPFQVGDWIVVGGAEGTVEEIGFRSTKIRTFYNSLISVPNADLATKEVDNMGRREYRRVREVLGITYDTPPEKIEAFLEGIKNIIKSNEYTRKNYYHVVFSGYGGSSLNILIYFFLRVPDWSTELVEKQNVFIEILRLAKELNIDFAFPTRTLHIESSPEHSGAAARTAYDIDKIKRIVGEFAPGGSSSRPAGLGIYTPSFKEKQQG
jgi:MscS family membrane protein